MFYTPKKWLIFIYKSDKLIKSHVIQENREYILSDMLKELYPNINTETLIRRYYHAQALGHNKVEINDDEFIRISYTYL